MSAEAMRNCVEYQWLTMIKKFDAHMTGSQEVAAFFTALLDILIVNIGTLLVGSIVQAIHNLALDTTIPFP